MKTFNIFSELRQRVYRSPLLTLRHGVGESSQLGFDACKNGVNPRKSRTRSVIDPYRTPIGQCGLLSLGSRVVAVLCLLLTIGVGNAWGDTYEQLTSIANIDESAEYVLGIDGTGFHYSGTSSWGLTALPSAQTPLKYTLKKAADESSFTAKTTINNTVYYLQIPTSNTFSMATSTGTNTDIIIGTTQVAETNYAVANKTTTARHLRINGASGLRSYAGTTGTMAFFYKVEADVPCTITWYVNGNTTTAGSPTTASTVGSKVTTLPTAPTSSDCDGSKVFVGWTNSSYSHASTAPTILFTTAAGSPTLTGNTSFYAVFATRTAGAATTSWQKTELSAVTAGTYALITPDGHAFNGTMSSGHGQVTSTAFSFTNNVASSAPSGTCEITLTAVTGGYTMYNSSNGYLYATKAGSGGFAWHNSESSYWKYSSSNWLYNSNSAYLRSYSNGSFRTYNQASNSEIYFVKKTTVTPYDTTNYATSCGACTASAEIGTASLNGPIFCTYVFKAISPYQPMRYRLFSTLTKISLFAFSLTLIINQLLNRPTQSVNQTAHFDHFSATLSLFLGYIFPYPRACFCSFISLNVHNFKDRLSLISRAG